MKKKVTRRREDREVSLDPSRSSLLRVTISFPFWSFEFVSGFGFPTLRMHPRAAALAGGDALRRRAVHKALGDAGQLFVASAFFIERLLEDLRHFGHP
jgi:hypothetical protein